MSAKTTTTVASADESKQTSITGIFIYGLPSVGDDISEELDKIERIFKGDKIINYLFGISKLEVENSFISSRHFQKYYMVWGFSFIQPSYDKGKLVCQADFSGSPEPRLLSPAAGLSSTLSATPFHIVYRVNHVSVCARFANVCKS